MTAAPVLVTYATRYGSTQEAAEAVLETLRERGLEVDLRPMREVRTLEGYRAVVLGAPLYMGRWHKDAQSFLAQHREALKERPVAVFALGPTSNDEQEMLGRATSSTRNSGNTPSLPRSLFRCSAAGMTRRSWASPTGC